MLTDTPALALAEALTSQRRIASTGYLQVALTFQAPLGLVDRTVADGTRKAPSISIRSSGAGSGMAGTATVSDAITRLSGRPASHGARLPELSLSQRIDLAVAHMHAPASDVTARDPSAPVLVVTISWRPLPSR